MSDHEIDATAQAMGFGGAMVQCSKCTDQFYTYGGLADHMVSKHSAFAGPGMPRESNETLRKAELFTMLKSLAGYVENGSQETVRFFQDDATRSWWVQVGDENSTLRTKRRAYFGSSLAEAIEKAYAANPPEDT